MNNNQPQQARTALWDSDVDMVLSSVYQQSSNISPYVTSTQQYINSIKVFDTQEKAQLAKSLVAEFNREATDGSRPNNHPSLSDSESSYPRNVAVGITSFLCKSFLRQRLLSTLLGFIGYIDAIWYSASFLVVMYLIGQFVRSATLFRLGIFTYEEAAAYLPGFPEKWSKWVDELQSLLSACAQFATVKQSVQDEMYDQAEF